MGTYLGQLALSAIPLPEWAVVVFWVVLFFLSHVLIRQGRVLSQAQAFVVDKVAPGLIREPSARLMAGQVLFAAAVFGLSSWIGGAAFVLLAGGWVVTATAAVAINLRSVLFLRAISRPGAAEGSVTFSSPLSVRNRAFHLFGAAALCFLLGVLLAHLALLGGALFLSATAVGYLRKLTRRANGEAVAAPWQSQEAPR